MNYNRLPLFLALVSWQGFTRRSGFAIPARRVLGFAIPLLLLTACDAGRHERMQQELLRARKMNKEYVDFTTDSVMKEVADYYDRHGTPNERMEAHYLLGCTYRDMGEAPRAVDCYLDAVACADTTAADCDFSLLARVYSQMADLYHKQLLLSYEIESDRRSSHYFFLAKDTVNAIFEIKMVAGAMILLNKEDSAEIILDKAIRLYREYGYIQDEIRTSTMLMNLFIKKPERVNELKQLIDRYDSESIYFDSLRLLPPSLRQYYYYKGNYFESVGQLDSAEYYYRNIYCPKMEPIGKVPMYKGLLNVYKKRHVSDSIAKYAQLYCEVNDSSITKKDQEITAQISASYNYSRYQKKSAEDAKKANILQSYVIVLLVVIIICIILSAILLHRHNLIKQEKRRIMERTKAEMDSLTREYEGKLSQLQQLETSHKKRIETIQKELGNAREKNKGLLSQNKDSQEIMAKLNTQFDEERNSLLREINDYASKVSELERQLKISAYKKNSMPFLKTGIVVRIKEYYAKDPSKKLSEEELKSLVEFTNDYFPDLISDLNHASGISNLGIHVCLLVALNIQPCDIIHLLDISSAQVGNLKKDINNALFSENTAKTLYKNRRSSILPWMPTL